MFKKVFGNLALDFGLLLLLAVLIAIFSLVGIRRIGSDFERLINHDVEIERLAAKIETDILHAQNLEEDFLLHLEEEGYEAAYENYVVPHNQYTESLEQDTLELAGLVTSTSDNRADDQEVISDLKKINTDIAVYEDEFARLIALLEERGTTEVGLEGEFRQKAAQIEEFIKKHPQESELQIALLELQLAEDNYLLHRSRDRADQVIFWYHELFGEVDDSTEIPRREKSQIETLLDTYDTEFERVVAIDEEIGELQEEINVRVDDIERLAVDIDEMGRREANQEEAHAQGLISQVTRVITVSVLVILVIGTVIILVAFFQLRNTVKPGETDSR